MPKLEQLKKENKVTATLEDGTRLNIQRSSWEMCFKRALQLGAVQVLDGHNHLWVRDGSAYCSMGIQKPLGKMKKLQ